MEICGSTLHCPPRSNARSIIVRFLFNQIDCSTLQKRNRATLIYHQDKSKTFVNLTWKATNNLPDTTGIGANSLRCRGLWEGNCWESLTAENNLTKQTQQNNISRAKRNIIWSCILNANEITQLLWYFCKGTKVIFLAVTPGRSYLILTLACDIIVTNVRKSQLVLFVSHWYLWLLGDKFTCS